MMLKFYGWYGKIQCVDGGHKKAQHSIHIEYYAFVTDHIGTKILNLLEEKAAEGVEVRLLYDAFGSKGTKVHHLNELKKTAVLSKHLLLLKSTFEVSFELS